MLSRDYDRFALERTGEIDIKQGLKTCGDLHALFLMMDNLIDFSPKLLGAIRQSDSTKQPIQVLNALQQLEKLLTQVGADKIGGKAKRFAEAIKSGEHEEIDFYSRHFAAKIDSLCRKIKEAHTGTFSEASERMAPIEQFTAPRQATTQAPTSGYERPKVRVKAAIIPEIFEGINKYIQDFELSKCSSNLMELMTFTFTKDIDEALEKIYGYLQNFDYLHAAFESMQLINIVKDTNTSGQDIPKLTLLAVDDLPDVLGTIKAMLKKYYNVFGAIDADSAFEFLDSCKPDLILLDIEMPEMDGFTLLEKIRRMPMHKDTPVIFLTGSPTPEYIKKAFDMGVKDFIKKPVDVETLNYKIYSLILQNKNAQK